MAILVTGEVENDAQNEWRKDVDSDGWQNFVDDFAIVLGALQRAIPTLIVEPQTFAEGPSCDPLQRVEAVYDPRARLKHMKEAFILMRVVTLFKWLLPKETKLMQLLTTWCSRVTLFEA